MSKVSGQRSTRRLCLGVWALAAAAGVASAQVVQEEVYRPFVEAAVPASLAGQVGTGAASFRIDPGVVAELGDAGNVASIELPIGPGAVSRVELFRQTVLSEDARVVVVGEGGVERLVTPQVQIWAGTLGGDPDSSVFLGLSAGQAQGWVRSNGHTWLIATRVVDGAPLTMAYEQGVLDQFGPSVMPKCAGEVVPEGDVAPEATGPAGYTERIPSCKAFRLAVDTDNEYRNKFLTTAAATEYAVVLAAASSDIYNRDIGSGWRLSYLRIWETADPWTGANTSAQLTEFRSYWRANMGSVTRASAHLLSGRSLGGGIAYLRAACGNNNGYGVSANLAASFPFPILDNDSRNWDLMVFSHELGHQFGSEHTHNSCAYNPVVDGCGLSASASACEQGTQDCSVGFAGDATIMSYCHQCSGGIGNMKMTFGPRVSARMISYVNGLSCPTTLSGPELVSVTQSPDGTLCGTVPVTFTAQATGTELRYQWFRNGVRLAGATSPTYTAATVVDGNRFDVMVYSACGTITTFGTPMGKVVSVGGGTPVITEQPASSGACPSGVTEVPVGVADGLLLNYRWEVRNLLVPSGWSPIADGPVVIGDVQVAVASNTATSTLSLSGFTSGWRTSLVSAGRAVRCVVGAGCDSALSVTSSSAVITVCRADLNCDGGIDGADIDAFFQLWETGDPGADFNEDGGVDGSDLSSFYGLWEGGC